MIWLVSVAFAVTVEAVPNPRPSGWVTDLAEVLDESAESALNERLEALHRDLDVEIAVVTVPSATGTDGGTAVPKEFATALFARWGIGDVQANNGLLVLLVLDARRLEMETGYGLEAVLPDGWLGVMQSQQMVPKFRASDYAGGLAAGLAAVDVQLREHPEDARQGAGGPLFLAEARATTQKYIEIGGGSVGVAALGVLGGVATARYRRKQRTCAKCNLYMPMLSEEADDAHLSPGQRTEEKIGSVDHQVHQCPECGEVRAFASARWFSGYSRCPQCKTKARTSKSTTLVAATQHSGGRVQVNESCSHCSYHNSYTRSTPALPKPSSNTHSGGSGSSGRSGGSFGGGRSGGGGAGSSW